MAGDLKAPKSLKLSIIRFILLRFG